MQASNKKRKPYTLSVQRDPQTYTSRPGSINSSVSIYKRIPTKELPVSRLGKPISPSTFYVTLGEPWRPHHEECIQLRDKYTIHDGEEIYETDTTPKLFIHMDTREEFYGKRKDFKEKYEIDHYELNKLIYRHIDTVKGWRYVGRKR